jgi:hypothetical protein
MTRVIRAPSAGRDPSSTARAQRVARAVIATLSVGMGSARAGEVDAPSPSVVGASGLYQISTAEVGPPHELRLALYGDFFRATSFLIFGDQDTRVGATVAAAWTVGRRLELFGALRTRDNRDAAPGGPPATDLAGDAALGVKAVVRKGETLGAGIELGARFPFERAAFPQSMSAWIDALGTVDLRTFGVPLRTHASAGFYFDNSGAAVDLVGVPQPARQRVLFADGIASDRVRLAVALDAPLEGRTGRVGLHPFAEYHLEIVTAAANPAFQDLTPLNRDQQWLTLGLRVHAGARVVVNLGTDLLTHSVGFPFGPPFPPYDVFVGLAIPLALGSPAL